MPKIIPAARCADRTVLYLPTAAPLRLTGDRTAGHCYFVDLETQDTLPAQRLYKAGQTHINQSPCYRDTLLIIEGE